MPKVEISERWPDGEEPGRLMIAMCDGDGMELAELTEAVLEHYALRLEDVDLGLLVQDDNGATVELFIEPECILCDVDKDEWPALGEKREITFNT